MNKIAVAAVGVVLLLSVGVVTAQEGNVTEDGEANVSLSFGEEISVLVSAQQTEVRNTVENEAFEIAFERDGAPAVEKRAQALGERLNGVEERKQELERAREEGNISEGRYRAKMAKLSFDAEAVNSSADAVLEKAEGLERAGERGVNVENIRRLKQKASNMTGQEVARIARGIAGRAGMAPAGAGPPEDVGRNMSEAGGPDRPQGVPGENVAGEDSEGDNDTEVNGSRGEEGGQEMQEDRGSTRGDAGARDNNPGVGGGPGQGGR
jgi:hypothetical protein